MKLKVCGIKYNPLEVAAIGPDYMGFIFWEGSSRYFEGVNPPEIPDTITRTGVFVNADHQYILDRVQRFGLGAVQLHGRETAEYCRNLKALLKSNILREIGLIKAFSVATAFEFEALREYLPWVEFFLFDTRGKLPGGNGIVFDWKILDAYPFEKPFFLSGGIGIDQHEKLVRFLKSPASRFCSVIDVNSKFENHPGEKNTENLKRFLDSDFWRKGSQEHQET